MLYETYTGFRFPRCPDARNFHLAQPYHPVDVAGVVISLHGRRATSEIPIPSVRDLVRKCNWWRQDGGRPRAVGYEKKAKRIKMTKTSRELKYTV